MARVHENNKKLLVAGYGRATVTGLLMLALALGVFLHRDFGMSWDEPIGRTVGWVSLSYVYDTVGGRDNTGEPALFTFRDRDYGVVFELPAAALEHLLRFEDSRELYQARHLLTFLFFLFGTAAVYLIAAQRFSSRALGVAAAALMFLHPRIFAHGFFNSKDSVFMSLFAIGLYALIRLLNNPSPMNALVAGLAFGVASGVRVVGLGLLLLGIAFVGLSSVTGETSIRSTFLSTVIMTSSTGATLFAVWPYLWTAPITNLREALQNMAQFRWNGSNRYFGEIIPASEIPWHYTPVWIGITTPLFILLLFSVGTWTTTTSIFRSRRLWMDPNSRTDALMVAAIVGPILATALLGSVLYDGWRHHHFVYPAMAILATRGVQFLATTQAQKRDWMSGALLIAVASSAIITLSWMIRAHPLHNVYFNQLMVADASEVFEVDYWGLANRQALEAILAEDPRPLVRVSADSWTPLSTSLLILDPELRSRVLVVDPEDADYLITNYRGISSPREQDIALQTSGTLFHRISIGENRVLSVYDMTMRGGE